MEKEAILAELKELTLALAEGRAARQATVEELDKRIDPETVFAMKPEEPQADFITEVFVSLQHLTEEGFATSPAEIQYLAECFKGTRTFSRAEVRNFTIGNFEKTDTGRKKKQ